MSSTGRYIVAMRPGASEAARGTFARAAGIRTHDPREFGSHVRLAELDVARALALDGLDFALVNAPLDQVAAAYSASNGSIMAFAPEGRVRAIDADPRRPPVASPRAAEPVSAPDGSLVTWGVQATRAHLSKFTGRGVRVAVLDSGVALSHPDFQGIEPRTKSFIASPLVQDSDGHGTHCAGIACGPRAPHQLPRYGVACDAELYVGRVLDSHAGGDDGEVLLGMWWAQQNRCRVISMSLGRATSEHEAPNWIMETFARRILDSGTLIVAAAGNDSLRGGDSRVAPVHYPANCPSILAVGAVDRDLRVMFDSNGGLNKGGGEVDIAAPGEMVRSAWLMPEEYHSLSGTSMATPFVAGIAALYAEAFPRASANELRELLLSNARKLDQPERDVGAGLVQAP